MRCNRCCAERRCGVSAVEVRQRLQRGACACDRRLRRVQHARHVAVRVEGRSQNIQVRLQCGVEPFSGCTEGGPRVGDQPRIWNALFADAGRRERDDRRRDEHVKVFGVAHRNTIAILRVVALARRSRAMSAKFVQSHTPGRSCFHCRPRVSSIEVACECAWYNASDRLMTIPSCY